MRLLAVLIILTLFLIGCSAEQPAQIEGLIRSNAVLEAKVRNLEIKLDALENSLENLKTGDNSSEIAEIKSQLRCIDAKVAGQSLNRCVPYSYPWSN